jgi:UbiD family decarboxylase
VKHLKSLCEFLDALRTIGELQSIDAEVDWNLQIGAVTRRSHELRAPAPLFNKIKGIEPGFRAFGAPGGLSINPRYKYSRIALALGFRPDVSGQQIIESLADARDRAGVPPRWLSLGRQGPGLLVPINR